MDQNAAVLTAPREKVPARSHEFAFQAAVFLTSFLAVCLRRPDAVLNAQFYAEDGVRWFADAYHFGWRCLLMPDSGYLQTVSRLVGLLSLAVPFGRAPLLMNLCALTFQVLPVNLFLTSRFKAIPLRTRLAGSLLYLALPNSFEVHANTTNIQWHLALAGLLVLLAGPAQGLAWRLLDCSILGFSVLDGAAGMLLTPVAAALFWKRRDQRSRAPLAVLLAGTALQVGVFILSHSRRPAANGATLARLTGILGGQVFLSSTLGVRTFIQLFFQHWPHLLLVQTVTMLIGLAIVLYAFLRGPLELKLFLLFAAAILTLALVHPVASFSGEYEQWEQLQIPGVGNRYYFFPMLAFLASLIWLASTPQASKFTRLAAIAVLALLPIGIARDWRYKPFVDYHFEASAAGFERASPGTTVSIPINPGWRLVLIKH